MPKLNWWEFYAEFPSQSILWGPFLLELHFNFHSGDSFMGKNIKPPKHHRCWMGISNGAITCQKSCIFIVIYGKLGAIVTSAMYKVISFLSKAGADCHRKHGFNELNRAGKPFFREAPVGRIHAMLDDGWPCSPRQEKSDIIIENKYPILVLNVLVDTRRVMWEFLRQSHYMGEVNGIWTLPWRKLLGGRRDRWE